MKPTVVVKTEMVTPIQNKSFPISSSVWERMWERAIKLYPECETDLNEARGKHAAAPAMPRLVVQLNAPIEDQIAHIQKFVESLQYNHTGEWKRWEEGKMKRGRTVVQR